jgi:hypothetical protein
MNSKTHRLIAIPKHVRLHKLADFADQEGCKVDIEPNTGLLVMLEKTPRRTLAPAPGALAVTEVAQ